MTGYTKLSSSMLTSTIWGESPAVCKLWITMLLMADRHGEVRSTVPGLARMAGVPVDDAEEALKKFHSPDPYSRTPDFEGRRVEQIDGGWLLLNHSKYRQMLSKEDKLERDRIRQERNREREKATKGDQPRLVETVAHPRSQIPDAIKDISSNADASDDRPFLDAVNQLWTHYLIATGRNPKTYSFTSPRKRKGLARLKECLNKTGGDIGKAIELMTIAIDRLAASDWHMGRDAKTNGKRYCDWDNHLFGSYEQMERWWNQ